MILFFSIFKILFLVFRYLDVLFIFWVLYFFLFWLVVISIIIGYVIIWLIVFIGIIDIDILVVKYFWSIFWKCIKLIRLWIINYSLIIIGLWIILFVWLVKFLYIVRYLYIINNKKFFCLFWLNIVRFFYF